MPEVELNSSAKQSTISFINFTNSTHFKAQKTSMMLSLVVGFTKCQFYCKVENVCGGSPPEFDCFAFATSSRINRGFTIHVALNCFLPF